MSAINYIITTIPKNMKESPKKRDIKEVVDRMETGAIPLSTKNVEAAFEAQCTVAQAAALCGTTSRELDEWCRQTYGTSAIETRDYLANRGSAKFQIWISQLINAGHIEAHKMYGKLWYEHLLSQQQAAEVDVGETAIVERYKVRVPDNGRMS